jgi:hypothetical protein
MSSDLLLYHCTSDLGAFSKVNIYREMLSATVDLGSDKNSKFAMCLLISDIIITQERVRVNARLNQVLIPCIARFSGILHSLESCASG